MSPRTRAKALDRDQRRAAIVAATLPLVIEHGRGVTTRQIAEQAGVAEGTIFRVFDSKEEVIDAAIASAFDLEPYLALVADLDRSGTVDEVISRSAQVMIDRFQHVFRVLHVLGIKGPPPVAARPDWIARAVAAHAAALAPHAAELTRPPEVVMHYVHLLAFSGSNPHLTGGRTLTADDITRLVLDGTRKA